MKELRVQVAFLHEGNVAKVKITESSWVVVRTVSSDGELMVDIRRYLATKNTRGDASLYPTQAGMMIPVSVVRELIVALEEFLSTVEE